MASAPPLLSGWPVKPAREKPVDEPFLAQSAELRDPNPESSGRVEGAATMPPPPTDWIDWLRGLDLNQRPLGYEPNELPGCSTPR